jgi:hypothetical protein
MTKNTPAQLIKIVRKKSSLSLSSLCREIVKGEKVTSHAKRQINAQKTNREKQQPELREQKKGNHTRS